MEDQLIIIRPTCLLSYEHMRVLRNTILKQRETGVIILPYAVEVILAPKDVEIKVEEKEVK